MSCPFYGYSLIFGTVHGTLLVPWAGNRCALITEAHSPCAMETVEGRAPNWVICPRNPEFLAMAYHTESAADGERIKAHLDRLVHLTKVRRRLPVPSEAPE